MLVSCSLYTNLSSIYDVQSLLQGADALALEVVDSISYLFPLTSYLNNLRCMGIELGGEGFIAILHRNGITAFCVVGNVDVEANDVASVDGLLIDGVARFVRDTYQIGFVERVEVDAKLLFVVFAI